LLEELVIFMAVVWVCTYVPIVALAARSLFKGE